MTTGKDVRNAIKSKGLSMEDAATKLGMSRQNLYYMTNKGEVEDDFVKNVNTKLHTDIPLSDVAEEPYHEKRRNQKNGLTIYSAPLVPKKAQAGYVRSFDQVDYVESLERYAIPPGVNPRGAVWRFFELQGSSMEPVLHDGDYILCSQVPSEDWADVRNFYIYVIVTETELLVKRIFKKNNDQWVLISENEEQNPQRLLDVQNVKELWVFRRHINAKAAPSKEFKIVV